MIATGEGGEAERAEGARRGLRALQHARALGLMSCVPASHYVTYAIKCHVMLACDKSCASS